MGRKKAFGAPTGKEQKLFCFYCDRTFDDETVLCQHQRAKHFRCPECDDGAIRGKCESVQGLIVHTLKVHGKGLSRVPNALQGRDNPELNVYGMDGIPDYIFKEKGLPIPGEEPPPPARGAGRGGVPPAPGIVSDAPPPSIPPMPGMPGVPDMQGLGGLPALPGMPGLPPIPPIANGSAPGVPQDFLDFLGKAGGPPPGGAAPPILGVNPPLPGAPPPLPPDTGAAPLPPGTPGGFHSVPPQPGFEMSASIPAPTPSLPPLNQLLGGNANGAFPVHANPSAPAEKRPRMDVASGNFADEDVSVEELRARLPRYGGRG